MRKLLRLIAVFFVIATLIPSCELLEDCKTCTLVKENSTGTENGTSASYCGAELAIKESEEVYTGENTPSWEKTYYDCQ